MQVCHDVPPACVIPNSAKHEVPPPTGYVAPPPPPPPVVCSSLTSEMACLGSACAWETTTSLEQRVVLAD